MKARITIHTYNDEIMTKHGDLTIERSTGKMDLTFSGLEIEGTNRGDDGVYFRGDNHEAKMYWKNPWTLTGKWKSSKGEWKKLTISMKEIKSKRMIDWWDKDYFADVVESALISNMEDMTSKEAYDKLFLIKNSQFEFLRKIGPHFLPFMNYTETDSRQSPFEDEEVGERFTEDMASIFLADYDKPPGPISITVYGDQDPDLEKEQSQKMMDALNIRGDSNNYITYRTANTYMYYLKPEPKQHKDLATIPELWTTWSKPYALYKLAVRDEGGIFGYKIPMKIDFKNNLIGPIFPMSFTKALTSSKVRPGIYELPHEFKNHPRTRLINIELQKSIRLASIMLDCDQLTREKDLWKIVAMEGKYKGTFSVDYEQIKSLLYARDAPVTQTGRLKYIRHWVRSHQRRVENGTELTRIPRHLRGVDTIQIGTTIFRIINP